MRPIGCVHFCTAPSDPAWALPAVWATMINTKPCITVARLAKPKLTDPFHGFPGRRRDHGVIRLPIENAPIPAHTAQLLYDASAAAVRRYFVGQVSTVRRVTTLPAQTI